MKEALGYVEAVTRALRSLDRSCPECNVGALTAGAYTRPLFSST